MSASNQIISRQIEWAKNKGMPLTGSHEERGLEAYTTSIEANLFQPLSEQTRIDLEAGDGGELKAAPGRPAKIQALHSSSSLGINMFDYWRGKADLSILTTACGLSRAGSKISGNIWFEQKYSIDGRFRYSPNLDVVICLESHVYKAFAVECKFTEAYSSRGHGGIAPKYFDSEGIWQNLPHTSELAQKISPADTSFKHLHAAQLIKHILGLNCRFGHKRYRLLYLWYDALGEPGASHRQEIKDFSEIVRKDGVIFQQISYQELILRLAKHRAAHPEYVMYLTDRYL